MKRGSTRKLFFLARRRLGVTLSLMVAALIVAPHAQATSPTGDATAIGRYVVELQDPPLAAYDGTELLDAGPRGPLRMAATAPEITGEKRLNVRSPASMAYLAYLEERHAEFTDELRTVLGRSVEIPHRYRVATNGFALHLTPDEADLVRGMRGVKAVERDRVYRLQTYAGPQWLGADRIWDGLAGFPDARGEGVVVGVIDSGINWDHPSFSDDPEDGFVFENPYGAGLGLCSDPEVLCNEKLAGVYDFVTDDPNTPDVEEENTKGKDNDGHGSHTASIATGRSIEVSYEGLRRTISGVAPRAMPKSKSTT